MLQQLLLHCYLYYFIELLADFLPHAARHRRKMLVFDRLSVFPLTLVFLSCSPLYSLPFHFDTISYFSECLGLSLAEYARYSLLLYFPPLLFCLIGRCSRRWSPGAEDPRCLLRRRVFPMARSNLVVPRQEASPFRSVPLMLWC